MDGHTYEMAIGIECSISDNSKATIHLTSKRTIATTNLLVFPHRATDQLVKDRFRAESENAKEHHAISTPTWRNKKTTLRRLS